MRSAAAVLLLLTLAAAGVAAQESLTVAADRFLETSGFLAYLTLAARAAGVSLEWNVGDTPRLIVVARGCGADAILLSSPQEEGQLMREGTGALRMRIMIDDRQNQWDLIAVNPGACRSARLDAALKLVRWITSDEGQKAIASFVPKGGGAAYTPNAGTETCTECQAKQY